jgi:hypothetical protein
MLCAYIGFCAVFSVFRSYLNLNLHRSNDRKSKKEAVHYMFTAECLICFARHAPVFVNEN